ncbi:MAG: tetratricopeptide repeat protein [Candidatus Margulisiibacteriota bacterium]
MNKMTLPFMLILLFFVGGCVPSDNYLQPISNSPDMEIVDANGIKTISYKGMNYNIMVSIMKFKEDYFVVSLQMENKKENDIAENKYAAHLFDGSDLKPLNYCSKAFLEKIKGIYSEAKEINIEPEYKYSYSGSDSGSKWTGEMQRAETEQSKKDRLIVSTISSSQRASVEREFNNYIDNYFQFRPLYPHKIRQGYLCYYPNFKLEYPLIFVVVIENDRFEFKFKPSGLMLDDKTKGQDESQNIEQFDSADKYYEKGQSFYTANDYKNALPYLKKALEINPGYAIDYSMLGYCQQQLGQYKEAVDSYNRAIQINPADVSAYLNLSGIYSNTYHFHNKAIEILNQGIKYNPNNARLYNNLGLSYFGLGNYDEGKNILNKAIEIQPDLIQAHASLGIAFFELGQYNKSIGAFKRAISLGSVNETDYLILAQAYYKIEHYEEAIKSFEQVISLNSNSEFSELAHIGLSNAYLKLGQIKNALEFSKLAIYINPSNANAHLNMGICYLSLGEKELALNEYKTLKALDKDMANKLLKEINQK